MTTPGEDFPDKQTIVEDTPRHVKDPMEGMLDGNKPYPWLPKTLVLLGVTAVAGIGYWAYETTSHHHSPAKKPATTASPFPGSAFAANFNLSELNKVIDEQGRVKGDAAFPSLRANEVNMTAICEASDKKIFKNQESTIVIYKANQPKTGFNQVSPTVEQQTELQDIARYSQTFPGTFSGGGSIGTENAEAVATSVHQKPCQGEGSLWGYKDQSITSIIPSTETIKLFQPDPYEGLAIIGVFAIIGAAGYGAYRIAKRKMDSTETAEIDDNPDVERAEQTAIDESINEVEQSDDRGWGLSELNK